MKDNIKFLTNRLKELFSRDDAFVLSINGKWGVGKTHFWNNFRKNELSNEKNIAYVSLFGKETIQDIRTDIILQISKKDSYINSVGGAISNVKSSFGFKDEEINFGLSGSIISSMMTLLKKKDFKDVIVCFDDFERLSKKLDMKDILGLISELKEQKNCKVVLLLNRDKLKGKTLSIYKDKIIDFEFEYSPTPEQSYALIESSLTVFTKYPRKFFKKNNINNIRVMKRVINSLNDFSFIADLVKDHQDIEREIAENIIEISTINSMFMFKDFKKLSKYSMNKSSSKSSYGSSGSFKKNKKYDNILSYIDFGAAGVFYPSDITEHIIEYTKSSFVYKKPLIKMVEKRIAQINRSNIHTSIRAIYDKFNFNMSYTNLEFTQDLFQIFQTNSDEIIEIVNVNNFLFYINLLKELNNNDEKYHSFAVELFRKYLPIFLPSGERHHSWGEAKIKNIREFDSSLNIFINEFKADTQDKKVDNIEKVIALIKKPVESNSWGKEPQLLMTVSDETYEKYILESQDFVEACFDLIRYFGKNSNSGFELFIERMIKKFEKLQESDNENYKVKMTKMLNFIDKK
jgi:hypothetical protein